MNRYEEISLDITERSPEELEREEIEIVKEMRQCAKEKKGKVLRYIASMSGTGILTWEHLVKKFDLDVRMEKCHLHNGIGNFGFYTDISRYAMQIFDLYLACKPLYTGLPLGPENFEII